MNATLRSLKADTRRRIEAHIANLGSEDQDVSSNAERRLIRFGPKAVDALMEACDSVDPQVRFRAVWALGKVRDIRALDTVVRLTNDLDERVNYDATLAIGELGDERVIPHLAEMVRNAKPEDLRPDTTALRKLGPKGIEALKEICITGGEHARKSAEYALESEAYWGPLSDDMKE